MKVKSLRIIYKALYAFTIVSMVASAALTAAGPATAADPSAPGDWYRLISADLTECDDDQKQSDPGGDWEPGRCKDVKATYHQGEGDECGDEVFYGDPGGDWEEGKCEKGGGGGGDCAANETEVNGICYPNVVKTEVCHATSSETNPFNLVNVSIHSVESAESAGGHANHVGDAWSFDYWGVHYESGDLSNCEGEEPIDVCEDRSAANFEEEAPCVYYTCTDDSALNYHENTSTDPEAESDCVYEACDDENAINFGAEEDCLYYTCTDEGAINYQENTSENPEAESDCLYYLCTDETAVNYHENTTTNPQDESDCIYNQVSIIDPGAALCGYFTFKVKNTTEGGSEIAKVSWLVKPGGTHGSIEPLQNAEVLNFGPADAGDYTLYAWIGDQGDTAHADSKESVQVTACEEPEVETERDPRPEVEAQAPAVGIPVTGVEGPVLIPVTGLGDGNIYLAAQLANLGFGALAMAVIVHGFALGKRDDEE